MITGLIVLLIDKINMNNGSVGKLFSKLIKWKIDLLYGYYKIRSS